MDNDTLVKSAFILAKTGKWNEFFKEIGWHSHNPPSYVEVGFFKKPLEKEVIPVIASIKPKYPSLRVIIRPYENSAAKNKTLSSRFLYQSTLIGLPLIIYHSPGREEQIWGYGNSRRHLSEDLVRLLITATDHPDPGRLISDSFINNAI